MKSINYQPGILFLSLILIGMFFATFNACKLKSNNSFIEEDVEFTNPADGAKLAGTFSKPKGSGNFPAVILISGSGLQDRDETVSGHKPFKVLANYLTKKGIAVLRFDDRGTGKSKGDVWNATIEVFAGDALAGFNYLKNRKDVNPFRMGIIGHSQGAMEGMMLASDFDDIAFLIMLAGPGVPWTENLIKANEENLRRQGKSTESIDAGTKLLNKMIPVMQAGGNYETIKTDLYNVIQEWKQSLKGQAKTEIQEFDKSQPGFWKTMASDYATPIYLSAVNFNPFKFLINIDCPVLSIIGAKDVQVLSSLNNPAIQNALNQAENNNTSILEIKNINHLFQKCNTGLVSEYEEINKSFNIEVAEIIANWIHNNSKIIPSDVILDNYSKQTSFTDPGEFAYLYNDLPASTQEICDLIKKQLIHPMEASKVKDKLPEGRAPEDGDFPTVSDMLRGLAERDSSGLTMQRKLEDRLVVACYHHALLLASILRHNNIPVRLRGGFARYYEEEAKVRFGHVICEVWDKENQQWILVDPDRNYIDVSEKQFEFPSEAWNNFYRTKFRNTRYISSVGEGFQALIHALLLDNDFVLYNERNYWHTPAFLFTKNFNLDNLEKEQIQLIDQIATLMINPDINIKKLQRLHDENPFIHEHARSIMNYYEKIEDE